MNILITFQEKLLDRALEPRDNIALSSTSCICLQKLIDISNAQQNHPELSHDVHDVGQWSHVWWHLALGEQSHRVQVLLGSSAALIYNVSSTVLD